MTRPDLPPNSCAISGEIKLRLKITSKRELDLDKRSLDDTGLAMHHAFQLEIQVLARICWIRLSYRSKSSLARVCQKKTNANQIKPARNFGGKTARVCSYRISRLYTETLIKNKRNVNAGISQFLPCSLNWDHSSFSRKERKNRLVLCDIDRPQILDVIKVFFFLSVFRFLLGWLLQSSNDSRELSERCGENSSSSFSL